MLFPKPNEPGFLNKNLRIHKIVLLLVFTLLFQVACAPTTDSVSIETTRPSSSPVETTRPSNSEDVYSKLVSEGNFTKFVMLFEAAGLEEVMRESSVISVFAVPDSTFEKLPDDILEILLRDEVTLQYLMSRHIVLEDLTGTDLRQASAVCDDISVVETLADTTMIYGLDESDQPTVDGMVVTQTDIEANNGQIHLLEFPISFPFVARLIPKNVVESIPHRGFETTWLALQEIGGLYDNYHGFCGTSELVYRLSKPGPFTLFVPTNQAFREFETTYNKKLRDVPTLAQFIPYHFLDGIAFDSNSPPLKTNQTFLGEEIEVAFATSNMLTINGNDVNIIQKIEASNGFVYIIDTVIIPPSVEIDSLHAQTLFNYLHENRFNQFLNHIMQNRERIDGYYYSEALERWGSYTVVAPINEAFSPDQSINLSDYIFKGILPPDSSLLSSFSIVETIQATNGVIYVINELPD
jgi:uncharacterized surface protein with fasciclin (FAS1) repeats